MEYKFFFIYVYIRKLKINQAYVILRNILFVKKNSMA